MVDAEPIPPTAIEVRVVAPDRWTDLETLFGPRGACGGCWCMWWRRTAKEFEAAKGEKNRRALERLVEAGSEPGLLAYVDGEPAGWVAVEPREAYPRLDRSRVLERVDDRPVWSISCFFVARPWRGRGLGARLVRAAVEHVRDRGGRIVEAYPVEPRKDRMPDAFAWTGFPAMFDDAGFVEVARRSETRPVLRLEL